MATHKPIKQKKRVDEAEEKPFEEEDSRDLPSPDKDDPPHGDGKNFLLGRSRTLYKDFLSLKIGV